MRAPRWFNDALARERARVVEDAHTDTDAVRELVARVFDDEVFAKAIVAEYVSRRLGTKRPHTKRPPWKDPDKRMAYIAQLHRDGMNVRQIAGHIGVSVGTVHADLKRWADVSAAVTTLPFKNAVHHAQSNSVGARVMNTRTEHGATVTTLRRNA